MGCGSFFNIIVERINHEVSYTCKKKGDYWYNEDYQRRPHWRPWLLIRIHFNLIEMVTTNTMKITGLDIFSSKWSIIHGISRAFDVTELASVSKWISITFIYQNLSPSKMIKRFWIYCFSKVGFLITVCKLLLMVVQFIVVLFFFFFDVSWNWWNENDPFDLGKFNKGIFGKLYTYFTQLTVSPVERRIRPF